MLTEVYY